MGEAFFINARDGVKCPAIRNWPLKWKAISISNRAAGRLGAVPSVVG
jgi:hypothetical protein